MIKKLPTYLKPFIKIKYSKSGMWTLGFLILLLILFLGWEIYITFLDKTIEAKGLFAFPFFQNLNIIHQTTTPKSPSPTPSPSPSPIQPTKEPEITPILKEFNDLNDALNQLSLIIEDLKQLNTNPKTIENFYLRAKQLRDEGLVEKALEEANMGYNLAQELLQAASRQSDKH